MVNLTGNDSINESCDIGEAGTRHGKSHVEIASGTEGYLIVDDTEYNFDNDGIYIGVYNNNTNQMIDLVRIWVQDEKMHLVHC